MVDWIVKKNEDFQFAVNAVAIFSPLQCRTLAGSRDERERRVGMRQTGGGGYGKTCKRSTNKRSVA